jgi:hypothetical protein
MKITKFAIILMLALVLTACSSGATESAAESPIPTMAATNTPEPTSTPATGLACLSGTWELVNIENYMDSVIPPEMAGLLTYVENSGTASANFNPDGTYTYQVNQFRVQYSMDMGSGPMTMEVLMNGEGNGTYEAVDDNTLTFTELDNSGVTLTATLGGEAINFNIDDAVGAFGSTATPFEFDCNGNTLLTYPPIEGALPVEYARVP